MYSQKLLEIFYNPTNYGVIKGANGVGKVVDETCGEIAKIYLNVQDNIVMDAQFQAYGSPALISAMCVANNLMINKTLDECSKITADVILAQIGGELPDNKRYVCPLAESVVKSAIASYYKKQTEDEE